MIRAKHYRIRGDVQGVGYRYFARQAAQHHGIRGFVRNLPDGDVEVHAEGEEEALQLFKQDLLQGPRTGHVDQVKENDVPLSAEYSSFSIRG